MANRYISDLHFGHSNVIRFDRRPFESVYEMNDKLIENWNSTVKNGDRVFILGDFIWEKESHWEDYLKELSGHKILIRGNHDIKEMTQKTRSYFDDVKDYKEVDDDGYHIILCHYCIPFHKHAFGQHTYMLYGHVHNTREYDELLDLRRHIKETADERGNAKGNFINVGCMMPYINYTPRTIHEIIAGDAKINQ